MEIGLFSKCVKDLIVNLDRVDVPGLGVFFAEDLPASISDKGNIINPPARKMYFRRQTVSREEGALFLNSVSDTLLVSFEQACVELDWCLSRIHSELSSNKVCVLPSLGEMKSSSSGEYFFISDENLDICPDSFGLEPVCVKMTEDASAPEVAAADTEKPADSPADTQPMTSEPVPAVPFVEEPEPEEDRNDVKEPTVAETLLSDSPETPVENEPEQVPQDVAPAAVTVRREKHKKSGWRIFLIVLLIIVFLIILAVVAAHFFPQEADAIIDSLLYTPEELQILGK